MMTASTAGTFRDDQRALMIRLLDRLGVTPVDAAVDALLDRARSQDYSAELSADTREWLAVAAARLDGGSPASGAGPSSPFVLPM
jgi:hypothetical protein